MAKRKRNKAWRDYNNRLAEQRKLEREARKIDPLRGISIGRVLNAVGSKA